MACFVVPFSLCSLCPSLTCMYLLNASSSSLSLCLISCILQTSFTVPSSLLLIFLLLNGCDSLLVHVSFHAERQIPLKTTLWLLCFSRTELLRLTMRSSEGSTSSSLLKFSCFLQINTVSFHCVSRYWVLWYNNSLQLCHLNTEWH